jgi:hypothetical protein
MWATAKLVMVVINQMSTNLTLTTDKHHIAFGLGLA